MKQVLLPTDFSDNALNAIFTAIKLEQENPCNFILLHTNESDESHQDALNKLEETLQAIAKVSDHPEHTFLIEAKPGDLASGISELVPKYDLDLIIMGTKGTSGVIQILLGSNTVGVLERIRNCAILIIPRKYNFQAFRNIVFPTEYAHFFSKGQLGTLVKLAAVWRSQILVCHVAQEFKLLEEQQANKKILKERLKGIHHSFYNVTIHTTVANAITEFAKEKSADMICLVHYHHTFLEKLTQEPVVKKVGSHTEIPLLVLPE